MSINLPYYWGSQRITLKKLFARYKIRKKRNLKKKGKKGLIEKKDSNLSRHFVRLRFSYNQLSNTFL